MKDLKNSHIINSITSNDDKYSWKELNCFFKPWAILFKAFNQNYFDMFLFITTFYYTFIVDDWFSKINPQMSEDEYFYKFSQEILEDLFKLKISQHSYKSEEDFHEIIMKNISDNKPVLVAGDLKELFYNPGYKIKPHLHYFIIRGYDRNRNLYYILDNMHLDNGASTVYENFYSPCLNMYQMAISASEYYIESKEKYFIWSIEELDGFEENQYKLEQLLLHHLDELNKIRNNNKVLNNMELSLLENENLISVNYIYTMVTTYNYKKVYYDILFKFLEEINVEKDKIDNLKTYHYNANKIWDKGRLKLLYLVKKKQAKLDEVRENLEKYLALEFQFRESLANILEDNIDKLKDKLNYLEESNKQYEIKNNSNNNIMVEEGKVLMSHYESKTYDTWIERDQALQVLYTVEDHKISFQCRVSVQNNVNQCFHSGLIIKSKNNRKFLFGIYRGRALTVFCPEYLDNYTIFRTNFEEDEIFLKVTILEDRIEFYKRYSENNNWELAFIEKIDFKVECLGVFSKTWEKINHCVVFDNISYNK